MHTYTYLLCTPAVTDERQYTNGNVKDVKGFRTTVSMCACCYPNTVCTSPLAVLHLHYIVQILCTTNNIQMLFTTNNIVQILCTTNNIQILFTTNNIVQILCTTNKA